MNLPSKLNQTLRSRAFAWIVHGTLWLLLYLAITALGGKTPQFHAGTAYSPPPQTPAPIAKLGGLFSTALFPKPANDSLDPFFTSYFVPPPSPAAPEPTTRKIEITYQGYYQAGDGPKHAVVKLADAFVDAAVGWPIVTNVFVAEATQQNLVLTNRAAQTNFLFLNVKKEIEVQIK
jgi:hypothetical protein